MACFCSCKPNTEGKQIKSTDKWAFQWNLYWKYRQDIRRHLYVTHITRYQKKQLRFQIKAPEYNKYKQNARFCILKKVWNN